MLASTLIRHLQAQIEKHGDLPVHVGHTTHAVPVNRARISGVERIHAGERFTSNSMFFGCAEWPDCIRINTTGAAGRVRG